MTKEEVQAKTQEFIKDYDALCAKHAMRIIPQLTIEPLPSEQVNVVNDEAVKE